MGSALDVVRRRGLSAGKGRGGVQEAGAGQGRVQSAVAGSGKRQLVARFSHVTPGGFHRNASLRSSLRGLGLAVMDTGGGWPWFLLSLPLPTTCHPGPA